jgi:hypothetical protein
MQQSRDLFYVTEKVGKILVDNYKKSHRRHSAAKSSDDQGCQMVYFQTKRPNLGKFGRVFQWKMLLFVTIWYIFYGHLVHFSRFVVLHQEKPGNPADDPDFFGTSQ